MDAPANGRMTAHECGPMTRATVSRVQTEATGPATLAEVMEEVEPPGAESGKAERLRPMPTGFTPLDDILNGGIRPGELLMIGGAFGVGKTIWALQVARNVVCADPEQPRHVHLLRARPAAPAVAPAVPGERRARLPRRRADPAQARGPVAGSRRTAGGLLARLRRVPRYAPVRRGDGRVRATGWCWPRPAATTPTLDARASGGCEDEIAGGRHAAAGGGGLPAEDPGQPLDAGAGDRGHDLPDAGAEGAGDVAGHRRSSRSPPRTGSG